MELTPLLCFRVVTGTEPTEMEMEHIAKQLDEDESGTINRVLHASQCLAVRFDTVWELRHRYCVVAGVQGLVLQG